MGVEEVQMWKFGTPGSAAPPVDAPPKGPWCRACVEKLVFVGHWGDYVLYGERGLVVWKRVKKGPVGDWAAKIRSLGGGGRSGTL